MKRFFVGMSKMVAVFALLATTISVNTCCSFFMYQEELPKDAQKLRKF